jgi:hypothetical protein
MIAKATTNGHKLNLLFTFKVLGFIKFSNLFAEVIIKLITPHEIRIKITKAQKAVE